MDTHGRHLLVEYTGCDAAMLDDLAGIEALMNRAAVAAHTTVVASVFHPFEPGGVTGVVVLEESHLCIHTWPESGYASVDFFTCGQGVPDRAHEVLNQGLCAASAEMMLVERGLQGPGAGMRMHSHRVQTKTDREAHRPALAVPTRPRPLLG